MEIENNSIHHLRKEYASRSLGIDDVNVDPIKQFDIWFSEAMKVIDHEVNVMTLATASKSGQPSARIVLLKGFDRSGFTFFTNYDSRKGKEIMENPNASLLFYWYELERQIRIEGTIQRISQEESKVYFQSRPKGSQIGAHASPQSEVIKSREELTAKVEQLNKAYAEDKVLPLPDNWGGYKVSANVIEFWQGRPNRLHDRIRYTQDEDGWKIERLAP